MQPEYIILHHSLTKDSKTVSWGAIRRYHKSLGWRDIGYNFGVELVDDHYEILLGRMPTEIGAHTYGYNHKSIGICIVGNFDEAPPPKAQWESATRLVSYLCMAFVIPFANVRGHRDFAQKTCPGKHFDMSRFRKELTL